MCISNAKNIPSFGGQYTHESGRFSLPYPVQYGEYFDSKESVAFYGPLAEYYFINFFLLNDKQILNTSNISKKEEFSSFGRLNLLKSQESKFPGSYIIKDEFLERENDLEYVVYFYLPKGSTFRKNGVHQDIESGFLVFREKNYVFIINAHYKPRLMGDTIETVEDKILQIKKSLISIRSGMKLNI